MDVKVISLDDMLSPEQLAAVKAKRPRPRVDLSDLVPRRPPDIEILEAIQVTFMEQINLCLTCKREQRWPLGLVAMHKIKRHGRHCPDLAGVALTAANQHPHLARTREAQRSTSIVCSECVEEARFLPQPEHVPPPTPVPGTPLWAEQFGWGKTDDIHKRGETFLRKQELIRRELEEPEPAKLGPEVISPLSTFDDRDANEEPTSYEDTR